jgi:hypothetical protein
VSLLQDIQSNGWTSRSPEKLILSREPYTKIIVNNTEILKNVDADLMIVFGHEKGRKDMQPSAVCLATSGATFVGSSMLLWGSRYLGAINKDGPRRLIPDTITTLADVTSRSKL